MRFEPLFEDFLVEYDLMPPIGLDRAAPLDTLGLESLHYVELMMTIGDAWPGVDVADIEIDAGASIGAFIDLIDRRVTAAAQ